MEPNIPSGYRLDESDPDVLVLRRRDGAFVAAFSAMGATKEGIREAAKADRAALLREQSNRWDSPPGSTGALDAVKRPTPGPPASSTPTSRSCYP